MALWDWQIHQNAHYALRFLLYHTKHREVTRFIIVTKNSRQLTNVLNSQIKVCTTQYDLHMENPEGATGDTN